MCELLSNYNASEWAGMIQALAAIISSIFLFLTFNSQIKSARLSKETSEIDKKAKRAEYLPILESYINVKYPTVDYGFDLYNEPFNGEDTHITVDIIFNKNPVQLISFQNIDNLNNINITTDKIDQNNILLPGSIFRITFVLNFQIYFDLINEHNLADYNGIIESSGINYRDKLNFNNELIFIDMLNNKYKLQFKIEKTENLLISDLRIID